MPLIIVSPRHSPGQRTSALVELLDLYPTLVDGCALPQPEHPLEGLSLMPLLDDPSAPVKTEAFTWHPRPAYPRQGELPTALGYSMRTDRHRYTEWRRTTSGAILAQELYNHATDPHETNNIAPNEPATLERLSRRLAERFPPAKF